MQRSDIVKTIQSLAPKEHAVLFYSNIDTKRELVFPFLHEAIQKQGIAVYASEHEPLDELRESMKHWGIYVDRYEQDHSLIITDHVQLMEAQERLNDLRSNQLLNDLMERLMKRGGPIRVVGDPTMLAKRGPVDELVESERTLGRHLEFPLAMICCYEDAVGNIREGEFLIEILQAHSHAIFPGMALRLA